MCEGFDVSVDARDLKPSSVILQFGRLRREKENIIIQNKFRDFSVLFIFSFADAITVRTRTRLQLSRLRLSMFVCV